MYPQANRWYRKKAMSRLLVIEGNTSKNTRHKAAFLGVGARVIKFKKEKGATAWNSKSLVDCIQTDKSKPTTVMQLWSKKEPTSTSMQLWSKPESTK